MEAYYRLGEVKSKGLRKFYKTKEITKADYSQTMENFKKFLSPQSLIKEDIAFCIKEDKRMLISQSSIGILYDKIESNFGVDMRGMEEKMFPFFLEQATPQKFNNFNEFIEFQEQKKPKSAADNEIESFINKRFKSQKAIRKEEAQKRKNESRQVFHKKLLNNFTKDSIFVAIDFECLYSNNDVPVEVGVSVFKIDQSLEKSHFIFDENITDKKQQPKKFRKSEHFSYGESLTLCDEAIKEKLNKIMAESDYIICHASQLEKRMLRKLGVDFDSEQVIDSQLWYKAKNGEKQVKSLEKIAKEYDMDDVKFHNAGNDAVVTGMYFRELIKESRPELFVKNSPKKEAKKENRRKM